MGTAATATHSWSCRHLLITPLFSVGILSCAVRLFQVEATNNGIYCSCFSCAIYSSDSVVCAIKEKKNNYAIYLRIGDEEEEEEDVHV